MTGTADYFASDSPHKILLAPGKAEIGQQLSAILTGCVQCLCSESISAPTVSPHRSRNVEQPTVL